MLMSRQRITGIPFTSRPEDEGFEDTFVPVVGLANIKDFDYDSETNVIYWMEVSKGGTNVSDATLNSCLVLECCGHVRLPFWLLVILCRH